MCLAVNSQRDLEGKAHSPLVNRKNSALLFSESGYATVHEGATAKSEEEQRTRPQIIAELGYRWDIVCKNFNYRQI